MTTHRVLSTVALAFVMAAAVGAQGLDVKTGQWMWTVTLSGTFTPPAGRTLPPDVVAKILEEAKKPRTMPGCLTAEDLRNFNIGKMDDEDDCKVTSRKATATTADFVRTCTGDEPRTETVHIEVASRESMRVTASRSAGAGPASVTMAGKWVGATCKDDLAR